MGFYVDLTGISLDEFKRRLTEEELLPSQQILKEDMDERFGKIAGGGVKTMAELKTALKTKKHVGTFAARTALPEEFLIVLRREVNSYHPQTRKIKDFPGISDSVKEGLEAKGVKNTMELYDAVKTPERRKSLAQQIGASEEEMLLLTKLTDLSRIRYVNHTFATLLTNSEYDTVEKLSRSDYREVHRRLMEINGEKNFFKGSIALSDMRLFINDTGYIPLEIVY